MTTELKTTNKIDWEGWIPWIIVLVIILIVFPYNKIKEFFTSPKPLVEYVQVPVYIDKPIYIDKPVYIDRPTTSTPSVSSTPSVPDNAENVNKVIKPVEPPPKEFIVCAFGFENVLNAGSPVRCLEMCKYTGCNLAILTTSNKDNANDIPLEELGFTSPHYKEDNYFYNPNSSTSTLEDASNTRLDHLNKLKQKFNIKDNKRIILFDDNRINIDLAESNGFSVIQIGTKHPGIQEEDIKKAFEMIKNL